MADEYRTGDEASTEMVPPNVVADNSGVIPVQPVATTDPTIDDNTNPRVFFDGADPRNIPPHDSNEQLHISADKRIGAERSTLRRSAERRREAVTAAYDNSKDVRDVLDDEDTGDKPAETRRASGQRSAATSDGDGKDGDKGDGDKPPAGAGPRATAPQGRTTKPTTRA